MFYLIKKNTKSILIENLEKEIKNLFIKLVRERERKQARNEFSDKIAACFN